jgi:hypothetical protein
MRCLNRKSLVQTIGAAGLGLGLVTSAIGAPAAMAQEKDSKGVVLQLLQHDEGNNTTLSDDELKQLLIQLLQEKVGMPSDQGNAESVPALKDDESVRDIVVRRLQDGKEGAGPADFEEKRFEAYNQFTKALADELGINDPDKVDAAIRIAMMSVIDSHVGDGMLTKGEAEALKFLIATSDVPLPPGLGFGMGPGRFFIATHGGGMHGPMFGPDGDHLLPDREGLGPWTSEGRGSASANDSTDQQWTATKDRKERSSRADKGAKDAKSDDSQANEEKQG